jgi:hypothetical protein
MWQGAVIAMNLYWQAWFGQLNVNKYENSCIGDVKSR